ncbi:hypothetical protein GCM10009646_40820 [Streptomyces aureus]
MLLDALGNAVPTTLGILALASLGSDPAAPCGPESQDRAEHIREHCQAVANHCREITRLILRRTGGGAS